MVRDLWFCASCSFTGLFGSKKRWIHNWYLPKGGFRVVSNKHVSPRPPHVALQMIHEHHKSFLDLRLYWFEIFEPDKWTLLISPNWLPIGFSKNQWPFRSPEDRTMGVSSQRFQDEALLKWTMVVTMSLWKTRVTWKGIPEVVQVGQMPMPLHVSIFFDFFDVSRLGFVLNSHVVLLHVEVGHGCSGGWGDSWSLKKLCPPRKWTNVRWKGTISKRTVVLQTSLFRGSGLVMGGVLCHHNLSWEQLMYTVPELRQFRVRSSILMRDTCTPEGSLKLTNPPKDWHTQSWWFEKWESRVTYQIIIVIQPVGKLIIKLK